MKNIHGLMVQKILLQTLIDSCLKNKLVPEYLQDQFSSVRESLRKAVYPLLETKKVVMVRVLRYQPCRNT